MSRGFPVPFLLSLALVLGAADAAALELFTWQSEASAPRVILPVRDGETREDAVKRYLLRLKTDADLRRLARDAGLAPGRTADLAPAASSAVRMAFIANWADDMTARGDRIQRNLKTFSEAGADPYVIALAADNGLPDREAREFREKVAASFDLLVALGGHDVAPETYGEADTFSRDTNAARDRSELALVKAFKAAARGIFFGICRGHQLGAVADGHSMHQDLTKSGAGITEDHLLTSRETGGTQTWHHVTVEKGSLLERFLRTYLDANGRVLVNSLHHQAVKPSADAASSVSATHPTSGVEALQQKNALGLSVQFHPEFPLAVSGNPGFSAMGFHLIKSVVAYARLQRRRAAAPSCSKILL